MDLDNEEDLRAQLAARNERIAQLERLVRWQAEGRVPEGSWVKQPVMATSPLSVILDGSERSSAAQMLPLTWVMNRRDLPARHSVRLPAEVLAEIASYVSDRGDLVSLGKASFQLLQVAMHELMVRRPVRLSDTEHMALFFCHRGRAPGFPFWLTGNQARLRPILSFAHLTHLELPYLNDEVGELFRAGTWLFADRAMDPTDSPPLEFSEGRSTSLPREEDRIRLTSLTLMFPPDITDDVHYENPDDKYPFNEWYDLIFSFFNPTNLVLLRIPTEARPLIRLNIWYTTDFERLTRLERCICVGVVPQITINIDPETSVWDLQPPKMHRDGVPDLVVFLIDDARPGNLARKAGRFLEEPMRDGLLDQDTELQPWNVQYWIEGTEDVKAQKASFETEFPSGIHRGDGERFLVDWKTWTRGTKGDERHTRLFGLPFEEEGWLSQAWFDKYDLE